MKRELQRIDIPGEHDARERTWRVLQTAFVERERVTWPRRHARSLVLAAAGAAIVAAAVTPPGQSVVNSIRDAVGREKVVGVRPAHRDLPAHVSQHATDVVHQHGLAAASGSRQQEPRFARQQRGTRAIPGRLPAR